MASQRWRIGILCSRSQINLDILLNCGQSFRWKRHNEKEWIGVIKDHVWRLRQTGSGVLYIVYGDKPMRKGLVTESMEKKFAPEECRPANGNDEDVTISFKLEGEKGPNVDVTNFKSEIETVGKNGHKMKTGRKRSSITTENNATTEKHLKYENTENVANDSFDSRKMGLCRLPTTSLKIGEMSVERLKELYMSEDLHYSDDTDQLHSSEACENELGDYFQTDINLSNLYDHWSSRDPHFKDVASKFEGIRMLRQDPTENLLSFVCSSNNHISRISSMVEKLCVHYGTFITEVDGEKYFSFPNVAALTGAGVEDHLRQLGFGYRAKFIAAIAKYITNEKTEGWLETLRDSYDYKEAKSELIKLMGVGAKVADCVCLMSLDKPGAVPVDTHVWQITLKNYMAKLQTAKSLTERIYNEIGDFYRELWGPYAGWAHSVLFTADLKQNKPTKETSNNLVGQTEGKPVAKGSKVKCSESERKIEGVPKTKRTRNKRQTK